MDVHVGKQIKKSRLERKMTQAELAEKVGCATITIRQYENGSREPGLAALQKIAFALGVRIEDLIEVETFDTGVDFDVMSAYRDPVPMQETAITFESVDELAAFLRGVVAADRMRQGRGVKTARRGHRAPESVMERRSMEVTVG